MGTKIAFLLIFMFSLAGVGCIVQSVHLPGEVSLTLPMPEILIAQRDTSSALPSKDPATGDKLLLEVSISLGDIPEPLLFEYRVGQNEEIPERISMVLEVPAGADRAFHAELTFFVADAPSLVYETREPVIVDLPEGKTVDVALVLYKRSNRR